MATATAPAATPSTAPPTVPVAEALPADPLFRLSLEQYQQIAEAGILGPKDRVVLLDGVLIQEMTTIDPHIASTLLAWEALKKVVPAGWHVRKEDPIVLPSGVTGHASVPEPDLSIVRGTIRDDSQRKPLPADVALVVEVADSSLRQDRLGLVRYAWAKIPVAWIIDLVSPAIEVSTDPTGPGPDPHYRTSRTYERDALVPVVLDGVEVGQVRAADLLP